jgi:hypoxanthine phosphoribosyltransferase
MPHDNKDPLHLPTPDLMSAEASRLLVNDRVFRPFINASEISEMVCEIAAKINADFAADEITALVILKGSVIFAADLVRRLHMPVRMEFTRASSYGTSMTSSGSIMLEGLFTDVVDRNVLIIEDIVDSGTTITELRKHLSALQPRSLTVAALLSKPAMHQEPVAIDYLGRAIGPEFVVGYGLDYAEYGRHLDGIWVLDEQPSA